MPTNVVSAESPSGSRDARDTTHNVSVVIPAYNAARTLEESIDSMLRQTAAPAEIVVVDDGSIDATPDILRRYGSRITTVRQPNGGLAAARNAGCAAATGEFVAFIDADDVGASDRLEVQIACMRSDPGIVLCHGDFSVFGEGVEEQASYYRSYYAIPRSRASDLESLLGPSRQLPLDAAGQAQATRLFVGDVYEEIAHGNFVHPPTMMFRRTLFRDAGAFDPSLRNMCDWEWIVRASRLGRFAFIDKPLIAYRLSPDQLSGARYGVQSALDVIEVAERIRSADPDLYQRHRQVFRPELTYYYRNAADKLADDHTARSLALLAKSLGYGMPDKRALAVLIKALLPKGVLSAMRRARGLAESPLTK